jgi:flagellar FliL protein
MAQPPSAPPAAAQPPAKKPSKLPRLLLLLAIVAGIAGGGWYYYRSTHSAHAAPVAKAEKPLYVKLDTFTVNLVADNADQYLQVGIVLQATDEKAADRIKLYMPAIRNHLLLLLSSKHATDLTPVAGKQKLMDEVLAAARNAVPGPKPVHGIKGVYFSSFVIQ